MHSWLLFSMDSQTHSCLWHVTRYARSHYLALFESQKVSCRKSFEIQKFGHIFLILFCRMLTTITIFLTSTLLDKKNYLVSFLDNYQSMTQPLTQQRNSVCASWHVPDLSLPPCNHSPHFSLSKLWNQSIAGPACMQTQIDIVPTIYSCHIKSLVRLILLRLWRDIFCAVPSSTSLWKSLSTSRLTFLHPHCRRTPQALCPQEREIRTLHDISRWSHHQGTRPHRCGLRWVAGGSRWVFQLQCG